MKRIMMNIVCGVLIALSMIGITNARFDYFEESSEVTFGKSYDMTNPMDVGELVSWDEFHPMFDEACDYIRENYDLANEWFAVNDNTYMYVLKYNTTSVRGCGYFEIMQVTCLDSGEVEFQQEADSFWHYVASWDCR